jgi:hypothetical protein
VRISLSHHGTCETCVNVGIMESHCPFPVGKNTTKEQWQFHTVEQALEDVVYFAEHSPSLTPTITRLHIDHTHLTPLGSSSVVLILAFALPSFESETQRPSMLRGLLPRPVEAQIDMSSYWQAAERAIPRNCSNDWVAVTKYVDELFTNGTDQQINNLKTRIITAEFTGPGGNTTQLDESGYLQDLDQFDVPTVVTYLTDPLGDFQVCLLRRDRSIPPNPPLTEQRNSSDSGVLRCLGDQERDRTCLHGGFGRSFQHHSCFGRFLDRYR